MRIVHLVAAIFLFTIALMGPTFASAPLQGKHLSIPTASINGDSVVISWANTPGNQQDWITVVKAGTSDKDWGQWTYTAGKVAGSYTAKGLTPGEYEARLYYNYPKGGFTVIERLKFMVSAGAPKGDYMSLAAAEYAVGKTVTITWFNTPGNAQDWITVVKVGTSDKKWGKWTYLKSQKKGIYEVKGLSSGKYEARLYYNYPKGGFKVIERLNFSVK